ncbi:MAG TPA: thioesterase family protein [Candidatus Sulfotelmatobacter sp.]|nr:thioesterase family protein [Candidatus Sulfotelmatobacter sp.]
MNSDPSTQRFEIQIQVAGEDIDELGHVNNVVYLAWVQRAAIAHWSAEATPAEKAEALWVVARHEIDYRHPARLGDRIVARTWVGTSTGRTFDRHTEIRRVEGDVLLARARTVWVPIEPSTGRPKSVSEGMRRRFSTRPEPGN